MNDDYKERLKACKKLEKAVSKIIRQVVKAKRSDDGTKEKTHNKEVKAETKERKAEEKERQQEEKALAKRRKEGEKEAMRAEREYEATHGMTPSATPGGDRRQGNGHHYAQKDNTATVEHHEDLHEVESPSTIGHSSGYGRPSNSSSRPLRQRTVTSELEAGRLPPSPTVSEHHGNGTNTANGQTDPEAILDTYVPPEKRPHHRLGFMGLWGQKVDSIEWYKVCVCPSYMV